MKELKESVWSVVRPDNERVIKGRVQGSGKTGTDTRGRGMGIKEGTGK